MKLVKKILRLLPLLFIIGGIISSIIYSNRNVNELFSPLDYFNFEGGTWDNFNDSISIIISNPIFENLYYWVADNISNSYLVSWSFCILVYELYLSLCFLMFDFINMVFDWSNKFIKKGKKLDD